MGHHTNDIELLNKLRDYARTRLKTGSRFSTEAKNILENLELITHAEHVAHTKVDGLLRAWREAVELETKIDHLILPTSQGYCIAFTEEEKKKALRPKSSNT